MISRIISAATVAIGITFSLLYVMHYLIQTSAAQVETRQRSSLAWLPQVEDSPIKVADKRTAKIEPPITPPQTRVAGRDGPETVTGWSTAHAPQPPINSEKNFTIGTQNNGLINIITVQPHYPIKASQRNLEGHVIVTFNVTALGTVSDVIVVETSNIIFNKSAVDAAYRFRYKARMIDGEAQATQGLRKLFRFHMEKS